MLVRTLARPVVLTSGNVSDEPIAYRDDDALARLGPIADAFLAHDRAVHIRTDDSVARTFRRQADAHPAVPRLRPRAGPRSRPRVPPPSPRLRRRAEEHVLPGQGPSRVRLAPHGRPGERRDAARVHRGHRALPVACSTSTRGSWPTTCTQSAWHQVRGGGPRRSGPAPGSAPPRAHRLLPGRQRRGRPGHRVFLAFSSTVPATGPTARSGAVSSWSPAWPLRAGRAPGPRRCPAGGRHRAAWRRRRLPRPRGPGTRRPPAQRRALGGGHRHGRQGRQRPLTSSAGRLSRRRGAPWRPRHDQPPGPGRDRAQQLRRPPASASPTPRPSWRTTPSKPAPPTF